MAENSNIVEVYIIAGQSNALGLSPVPENDFDKKSANILFYQESNVRVPAQKELVAVRYGLGIDQWHFGLEVGAAQVLEKEKIRACIIKYASDGTSLYDSWKARGKVGEDFVNLKNAIENGISLLKKRACEVKIKAMLWMQGENDAIFFEQASEYQSNLQDFIEEIRQNFGEDLCVAIGQTNPNNMYLPYAEAVNKAKKNISQKMKNVFFVKTRDLNDLCDRYHYGTENELQLGKRLMEAVIKKGE